VSSDTSPTIRAGNRIRLVPFHQFSWWNKYQIDPVWSASLGPIYFSDSYASSDDSVYLPGFLRFDAGVFAQIDATWKAQLNIENISTKAIGPRRMPTTTSRRASRGPSASRSPPSCEGGGRALVEHPERRMIATDALVV